MNRAHQFKHAGLRKAADASGYKYDAEAADSVRDAVIPSNPTNHYSQMNALAKSLGGGLFESYLGETQLSHATLTAAGCFYQESDDTTELSLMPMYGIEGDPMEKSPFMAFFFLFFGMVAFNDLMIGSPWTSDLRAIGDAAGLAGAI